MQDNRPAVYLEGDSVIYRASAIGHCLRSLWAARSGLDAKPFPKVIQDAMDEGTELESYILNELYEYHHWGFANGQQFQVELNVGAWNGKTLIVRGKMDERRDDGLSVDVKAVSESFFTHPIPDYYLWQQAVYAHGLGNTQYYMPIYNKDTKQFWAPSLEPYNVEYSRSEIYDRVLQVEEAFFENKMPTDCPAEFGCQYYYLHEQKPVDEVPEPAILLIRARIKLSQKIKTFEAAKKKLDEAITPQLSQDVSYFLDGYNIVLYLNPKRFNTDAAKALLTDAKVDWENDPDFWIEGIGTQLRMTPKKNAK